MDRFKNMNFSVDALQKELKPAALKSRAQNLNDRYSSPSSSSSYRPSSASVPPVRPKPQSSPSLHAPPPTSVKSAAPAQPPRRSTHNAPDNTAHHSTNTSDSQRIDWRNLRQADKDSLFKAFDAVFTRGRNPPLYGDNAGPSAARHAPGTLQQSTILSIQASSSQNGPYQYPAPSRGTSHAQDLAYYFSASTSWDSAWFTGESITPPVIEGRRDVAVTASWQQMGTRKTLIGSALFSDLSVAWWRVEWDLLREHAPDFPNSVSKQAKYMDGPAPFEAEDLWDACYTYGEQIAQFAEQAERNGIPIAHGECWDLANEALQSLADLEPAVPSISRTHGHLIFSGSATGKDCKRDQTGTWRGGDTAVRRGDIVEWRKARVRTSDGRGWSELGAPEHTGIIVQAYAPEDPAANTQPRDGEEIAPWSVAILEVVEQSQGKPPSKAMYDLAGLEDGHIWIYRPVSMKAYVGISELQADWEQESTRGQIHYVQ